MEKQEITKYFIDFMNDNGITSLVVKEDTIAFMKENKIERRKNPFQKQFQKYIEDEMSYDFANIAIPFSTKMIELDDVLLKLSFIRSFLNNDNRDLLHVRKIQKGTRL